MVKKKMKKGSAWLLALMLTGSTLSMSTVWAAAPVDTGASCKIAFSIAADSEFEEELKSLDIPVNLYQVATINTDGSYEKVAPFDSDELDVSALENESTSADEWLKRAEIADGLKDTATGIPGTISNGEATMEGLATGLYLVVASEVQSPYYIYSFTPYLISLPDNNYYDSGSDEWIYELTGSNALSLKPEQTPRYGNLLIDKALTNQHVTMGPNATFVFQVDITTLKNEISKQIVALAFDEIGSKQSLIEHIPAGATVNVKEIYQGSGYQLAAGAANPQTGNIIVADDQITVNFANEHDGTIKGGYGVVNNYRADEFGGYGWSQLDDNSFTAQ